MANQKEQTLAELQKGINTYRNLLGLHFERVGEERLRLVFTHIDDKDPSRTFSFQVFVDPHDKYHVEDCTPTLPELPQLISQLNGSNDFSAFVRGARKAFKALVAWE